MKLVIEGRLPSLNEHLNATNRNRFAGAKMKSDTEAKIGWFIKAQLHRKIKGKYRVDFSWYEPNKRRDIDNIIFAHKYILDALVRNGIVEDDSQKYLTQISDRVLIDQENPRIEVLITSV